jgi:hypothetical protein
MVRVLTLLHLVWARLWGNRCHLGCIVGESGILWALLPEPGWQGSSHPATRVLSFQALYDLL